MNLYASFARGLIQGEINQLVVDADARERAQFDAFGIAGQVPEEILDSYEIGWKQQFLDRRIVLNSAFYYGEWSSKKSRGIFAINFTCGDSPAIVGQTPGCRPALGEANTGQLARNADGSPALTNSNVVAPLDVTIWGAEIEASASFSERFEMGGALIWARSEMGAGQFVTVASIAGSSNIKGNANPRFPEWSGSLNGTYTAPLTGNWKWFTRGDVNYFGKAYVDLDNFAQCKAYTVANARVGVQNERTRFELFVRNLFDDDSWAACARFLEFDLPQDGAGNPNLYQTVIVAPQLKRQIGLRASYKF